MTLEESDTLRENIRDLEQRLEVAEETLRALRSGEVDAIVSSDGDRIYTLKGADEPYRLLVEEMGEGALTLTRGGLILFSNERFADMLGIPLERVIGSSIQQFVAREEVTTLAVLLAAPGRAKAEVHLVTRAGTPVPAYLSVSPLLIDEIDGVCLVVTDLSQQKRNEELVAAELLARSILEQSTMAIVVINLDGRVIRASDSVEELTGKSALQQSFDDLFDLHVGAVAYSVQKILSDISGGRTIRGLEATARLPYGRVRALLIGAGALRGSDQHLLGAVVGLTDITERKVEEEELRRANEDLNQFAFAASHDLQEPLRMITNYSQLLIKGYRAELGGEAATCVHFITQGTHRMRELLADLLAYTQLTAEEAASEERIDLNLIFRNAVENCKAAIEENKAVITTDELPVVNGHDAHFVQLFQNLLDNAMKYRAEQAPRIHVSAANEHGVWRVAVADNGIGIDRQFHQRIFGVFKRLHGKSIPGTGIGLAICQRVVERYGGRIWVESHLNQGATFCFTLPTVSGQTK